MTPEEIRAQKFETATGTWDCARWLQEIAAQLAELNQHLKSGIAFNFVASDKPVVSPPPTAPPATVTPAPAAPVASPKRIMAENVKAGGVAAEFETMLLTPRKLDQKPTQSGKARDVMTAIDETGKTVQASIWDKKLSAHVANRLGKPTTCFVTKSKDGKYLSVVGIEV